MGQVGQVRHGISTALPVWALNQLLEVNHAKGEWSGREKENFRASL